MRITLLRIILVAFLAVCTGQTRAALTDRVGVMGDSLSDVALFPGTIYRNWVMQLNAIRGWNFGPDLAYDYALSGSTTLTLLSQGQHTRLAGDSPALAVLLIGGNDLVFDLLFPTTLPSDLDAFADMRIAAMRTAIEAVAGPLGDPTGTKVVLFTVPEVLRTPILIALTSSIPAAKLVACDMVADRMNRAIYRLAAERNWPVVDVYRLMIDVMGERTQPNETLEVGGVSINLRAYNDHDPLPTDGFWADAFHPSTVLHGLLANAVIEAVNQAYGESIPWMSDQVILQTAGVTDIPPGETYFDVTPYVWRRLPGDATVDDRVAFDDFSVLQNHYGQSGIWGQGDFNDDGQVTFEDFTILQNHYGQGAAGSPPAALTMASGGCGLVGILLLTGLGLAGKW